MLIAGLVIIVLLYRSYVFFRAKWENTYISDSQRVSLYDFFLQHFIYFSFLNPEEKQEFVTRSHHIQKKLEFHAVEDLAISDNIKILISAAFTQITFGYDSYYLSNFNTIFLHPSIFYSRWVDRDVKGLTFTNGRIHWSWDDFIQGYMFDNDKINLALHELAHALQIEYFENDEVDTPHYDAWLAFAEVELASMKANPEKAYFRAYAATNLHEFFAVSVEYFFEDAKQFREKLPQLYYATCKVLKQDMAARMDSRLVAG